MTTRWDALIRRDALLLFREAMALFPRWQDRVLGCVGLVLAGALLRPGISRAGHNAVYGGAVLAAWMGYALWGVVWERLTREGEVGLMAAAAVDPGVRRAYGSLSLGLGTLGVWGVGLGGGLAGLGAGAPAVFSGRRAAVRGAGSGHG